MLKYLFCNAENNKNLIRISGKFVPVELLVLQYSRLNPLMVFQHAAAHLLAPIAYSKSDSAF